MRSGVHHVDLKLIRASIIPFVDQSACIENGLARRRAVSRDLKQLFPKSGIPLCNLLYWSPAEKNGKPTCTATRI